MRHGLSARLLLVCVALIATASALRAQHSQGHPGHGGLESVPHDDGALVPPWGRHLEEHHPVEAWMASEEEAHHGEVLPRAWFRGDYLLWFIDSDRTPALLTRGLATSPRPGALDQPFTKVLDGGGVDFKERHGGQFSIGAWLAPESGWAIEADYLFLGGRDVGGARRSPGTPVLARPFFDVLSGREDSSIVSYPGVLTGAIEISNSSRLQGAEVNLLKGLCHSHARVEGLAGFRWLHLDEELIIQERSDVIDPTLPQFGTRFSVTDELDADNHFFGGQVGLREELTWKRFRLRLVQKIAFGVTRQTIGIRGRTVIDDGTPETFDAGLLALANNRGRHAQSRFAVVPEIGGSLGLDITEKLTFFAGYSFIYWSDVARPGAHIDRGLNPNLIPTSTTFGAPGGPNRPGFRFDSDDWWAHGVNVGLELKF
jgi:hypothetical protein